jgi:hypothetical protein
MAGVIGLYVVETVSNAGRRERFRETSRQQAVADAHSYAASPHYRSARVYKREDDGLNLIFPRRGGMTMTGYPGGATVDEDYRDERADWDDSEPEDEGDE